MFVVHSQGPLSLSGCCSEAKSPTMPFVCEKSKATRSLVLKMSSVLCFFPKEADFTFVLHTFMYAHTRTRIHITLAHTTPEMHVDLHSWTKTRLLLTQTPTPCDPPAAPLDALLTPPDPQTHSRMHMRHTRAHPPRTPTCPHQPSEVLSHTRVPDTPLTRRRTHPPLPLTRMCLRNACDLQVLTYPQPPRPPSPHTQDPLGGGPRPINSLRGSGRREQSSAAPEQLLTPQPPAHPEHTYPRTGKRNRSVSTYSALAILQPWMHVIPAKSLRTLRLTARRHLPKVTLPESGRA